jgi:NAD(P)H-hydrate epimerase
MVCAEGNPGMATGGMGDVLGGLIAALLAQGLEPVLAARLGVLVHARAADLAAGAEGERGLLASDLLPRIRQLLNGRGAA